MDHRIADVETFIVAGSRWGWVLVRLTTEDGWHGIGEASLEGRELTVATCVQEMRRVVVGQDPNRITSLNRLLYRDPIWTGGPMQSAISGIDMALWDLKAKRLGVPLHELLGGKARSEIRLYANAWWYEGGTPDDVAAAAKRMVDQGFAGVKFNPINRQPDHEPHYLSGSVLRSAVDYVAAVREAIGTDADLMVDLNACLTNTGDVLRVLDALAPFNLAFVEEPLAQENFAAMGYLRSKVTTPLASGERLFSSFDFENLFRAGAVDVAQPDLAHCGGISAGLKVAARAEMDYIPVAPHNPNGPVCESASAHLLTAISNGYGLLEHFPAEAWRSEVVGTPYRISDGVLRLSDAPGLGIDFDPAQAAARPYTPKDLGTFHERNFVGW